MNSRFFHNKFATCAVIAGLSAIAAFLADSAGLFENYNLRAYDALFRIRAEISERVPNPSVVMVTIDDRTFGEPEFNIPIALWHRYFETVIRGLSDGGAQVIGLDYLLPGELFDDMVPDFSQTWLRTLLYAKTKDAKVVIGFVQMGDRQILPHDRYLQIAGPENVGMFDLTTDPDDFIRRQRLVYPSDQNGKNICNIGYAMFRAFGEKGPSYDWSPSALQETIYIDFLPPDAPFPSYSFSDIRRKSLENDLAFLKQHFEGKIVIIGSGDSLSQDRHPTPLYHSRKQGNRRTPGAEIIANVVNTLLSGRFISDMPGHLTIVVCFVFGLSACLVVQLDKYRHVFIASQLPFLGFGSISFVLFMNLVVPPLVPGIAAIALSFGLAFLFRHAVLDREKRRIHAIFETFLTPRVAAKLLDTETSDLLTGEDRRLCVMFSDIRGFTTYSEKRSPEEIVRRLNEYYEAMSECVSAQGGIVNKFLGDGMLAFFGAFDADKNPSGSGVRSGLDMLDKLDVLNEKWLAAGEATFRIGVGLHTGVVQVGNIGSSGKMEYTITGDAVNLASRIQDKTKGFGETIVVSEDVYKDIFENGGDLKNHIAAEDKGLEDIRGRAKIRLYALRKAMFVPSPK